MLGRVILKTLLNLALRAIEHLYRLTVHDVQCVWVRVRLKTLLTQTLTGIEQLDQWAVRLLLEHDGRQLGTPACQDYLQREGQWSVRVHRPIRK